MFSILAVASLLTSVYFFYKKDIVNGCLAMSFVVLNIGTSYSLM